jgi:hypothetical protein
LVLFLLEKIHNCDMETNYIEMWQHT